MSLSICNYHLLTIHTKTFGQKPICLYSSLSLSLFYVTKMRYKMNKAKTSKLIKKKKIQNVTMTYRKIEYSFDIRMKIRMLEVYLNTYSLSVYLQTSNTNNKKNNQTIPYIVCKIQQKNICLTLILQSQTLCLYVFR